MQYHSFNRIWVCISSLLHPFKQVFFLQGQWPFFTVTTVEDCLFHQTYWFYHHPQVWPLVWIAFTIVNSIPSLRIFTIWWVSVWQRSMRRPKPNENVKLTTIHHRSLSPRGRLASGSVPQIIRYIYALPQNLPRSGNCQTDTSPHKKHRSVGARTNVLLIPDWGVGVFVLSLELVRCDTGTVTPIQRQLCI